MEPDLDALTWRPDLTSRDVTRERLDAIAFTPMSPRLRNEAINPPSWSSNFWMTARTVSPSFLCLKKHKKSKSASCS